MVYLDLILQVKSSKKNGRFDVPAKSFTTSQVLQQPERYEIEIEYIGSPKEDQDKNNGIFLQFSWFNDGKNTR